MSILPKETKKLILQQNISSIPVNTVIGEYTTPGTYTVTIPEDGEYEIFCIAAGGAEYWELEGQTTTPTIKEE